MNVIMGAQRMGRSDMADKKKATDSEDSKKHGNEQLREEERLLVFFFFDYQLIDGGKNLAIKPW